MTSSNQDPKSVRRPGGNTSSKTGSITHSQLFPVFSQGVDLLRRSFFLPAAVTLIVVIGLFAAVGSPYYFNLILGSYLGVIAFYGIYLVCGRQKPWWLILSAAAVTMIAMLVFYGVPALPVEAGPCIDETLSVLQRVIALIAGLFVYFREAGLPEELLKSIPIFACLIAGRYLTSPLQKLVALADPLDGILMGAAAGLGFTLLETFGLYVPLITQRCGELYGLQLLLPRTLGAAVGHMAWSGYFGYFIGLTVLRPRYRWRILITGYLSSAALHAFWDAGTALGSVFLIVPGAITLICLSSAIVRARQMAGMGSTVIAVDELGIGPSSNPNSKPSPLAASSGLPFALHVGTVKLDPVVGRKIRQADIPGLISSSPDNVVAEFNQNPRDPSVIGLMNLSVSAWVAMDPKSGIRKVEPGKSVRLIPGTRINFGSIFGEVRQ